MLYHEPITAVHQIEFYIAERCSFPSPYQFTNISILPGDFHQSRKLVLSDFHVDNIDITDRRIERSSVCLRMEERSIRRSVISILSTWKSERTSFRDW